MSPPVRLALLGFTPFECDHIRAMLGPGADTRVIYVQADDLRSSSLAVVNADHDASVAEVRRQQRLATSVMLGSTPCPGAGAQLGRAFNAAVLRRMLEALALATPPVSQGVQRVQQELARLGGSRFARPPAPGRERPTGAMPLIEGPAPATRTVALVVDESDITLRQLSTHLQDQGFDWLLARSAPEALERMVTHRPRWVFIATGLDSIDGFHTCRMVQHGNRPTHLQPQVVLVLAQDGAVDRLRAQLAGADGIVALPLDGGAVRALLSERSAPCPASDPAVRVDRALP